MWFLDIIVVVVWVLWGVNMFGSMSVRRENIIYVFLWYYIVIYVGIVVMYIFNNFFIFIYFVVDMGSVWYFIFMYLGSNDVFI